MTPADMYAEIEAERPSDLPGDMQVVTMSGTLESTPEGLYAADRARVYLCQYEQELREQLGEDGFQLYLDVQRRLDYAVLHGEGVIQCPICGEPTTDPTTIHDGWCEGHGSDVPTLENT